MKDLIFTLFEIFKQLSYLGIIFALSCELIPAEIVLPLAGYWVYKGEMMFWMAVLSGTIGGTLGPLILYFIGRLGGRPFFLKYGKYIFIREKQIKKADQFFQKYGSRVAFFGRFIPGIRTIVPVPCGIAKMNILLFTFYTFLAMLPLTVFYVWLGFKLGPRWIEVGIFSKVFVLKIVLILIATLCIFLGIKHIVRNIINSP